jgi:hypothetical protein
MANPREGPVIDRRRFVLGAAGTVAGASAATLAVPAAAGATGFDLGGGFDFGDIFDFDDKEVLPAPTPIPGGLEIAPGQVIHIFLPGDPAISLPFSGLPLGGFDVEPATITDFKGSVAMAFHAGTAEGSDGKTYNLESDIRAFEGEYVVNDVTHRGAFALF